jgi:SHAQKYF class myb-like DNA-binding protein
MARSPEKHITANSSFSNEHPHAPSSKVNGRVVVDAEERKEYCPNNVGKRSLEDVEEDGSSPNNKVARGAVVSNEEDGWTEDLHRHFVSAIFEIGLRNSSPAVILENMTQKPKTITSERVKSKLQKYRNNKEKSRQDFVEEYDAFLQRARAIENAGGTARGTSSANVILEMMGSNKLLGGDAAAFLSYAVRKEREATIPDGEGAVLSTQLLRKGALEYVDNFAGASVPFPELTETEKKSSLGVSMTFVMGLFLSMTQHLTREREMAENISVSGLTPAATVSPTDQRRGAGAAERQPKVSFSMNTAAEYSLQSDSGSGEETGEEQLNGSAKPSKTEMV